MIEKQILKMRIGSHLYGTNTEKSDTDYGGIFIPSEDYVFGLKRVEEIDLSTQDKDSENKNTDKAVDYKIYEIRKFIKLAYDNNPNILEMLFANDLNLLEIDDSGVELLKNRSLFPSQKCISKFLSYASSQKHKMIIKKDNYEKLEDAYSFLCGEIIKGNEQIKLSNLDSNNYFKLNNTSDNHYRIGERTIEKDITVQEGRQQLRKILSNTSSRKELMNSYGYDTKFASHLIRLLYEVIELLTYQEIVFPLIERHNIIDIKNGKMELSELLEYSEYLENKANQLISTTRLPKVGNYDKINDLCKKIMKTTFNDL